MALRVALCQMESGEPEHNLKRIEETVRSTDADLFLFPEMFLTKYGSWNFEGFDPEEASERLSGICRDMDMALAVGMPWKEGDKIYNSLLFVTPESISRYDKLYLANFPPYNEGVFSAGSKPALVEWKGFRFGLLICYDVMFPEIHRHYAVKSADAILMASASAAKSREAMARVLPARSLENTVYTLFCNNIGEGPAGTFFGGSSLYSPLGERVSSASDSEQVLVVTLERSDILHAREIRHHLTDLRDDIDWS